MFWYIVFFLAVGGLIWNRRVGGKVRRAMKATPALYERLLEQFSDDEGDPARSRSALLRATHYEDAEHYAFLVSMLHSVPPRKWADVDEVDRDWFTALQLSRALGRFERRYVGLFLGDSENLLIDSCRVTRASSLARDWNEDFRPDAADEMMETLISLLRPNRRRSFANSHAIRNSRVVARLGDDLLGWLKVDAPRDPAIWHVLPSLNWDLEDELVPALEWVVEQHECDTGTAIDILVLMQPDAVMEVAVWGAYGRRTGGPVDWRSFPVCRLMAAICGRLERRDFASNRFKPAHIRQSEMAEFATMLERTQSKLLASGKTLPWTLPKALASIALADEAPLTRYFANDYELRLSCDAA